VAHGDVEFELEADPSSKSACWSKQNFAEFAGEFAYDYFGKRHKAGLRVGRHGEAVLERPSAVSSVDPGAEDEGVAAVESDGWLDVDGSRRVCHVISGEIPYLAC
jgi:hypothetical protein